MTMPLSLKLPASLIPAATCCMQGARDKQQEAPLAALVAGAHALHSQANSALFHPGTAWLHSGCMLRWLRFESP